MIRHGSKSRPRGAALVAGACIASWLSFSSSALGQCWSRPDDADAIWSYGDDPTASYATPEGAVRVWYTTAGLHAPDLSSTRADLVPDAVALVGEIAEEALAGFEARGFRQPLSDGGYPDCNGGDGRLDIYLIDFNAADGTIHLDSCSLAAGGVETCSGLAIVENDFAAGGYADFEEGARTVVPHEIFHLLQAAYDANLPSWFSEGTAQWATKSLFPELQDLERFLPYYLKETWRSLDSPPGGAAAAFLYGTAIWPVFLEHNQSAELPRLILEQLASGLADDLFDAHDRALAPLSSSFAEEFETFAIWNVATGSRAGDEGYVAAPDYPEVSVEPTSGTAPFELSGVTSGASARYFALPSGHYSATLTTNDSRNSAFAVPIVDGSARPSSALRLSTEAVGVQGPGVIAVVGFTAAKPDASFTVVLEESAPPMGGSGGMGGLAATGGVATAGGATNTAAGAGGAPSTGGTGGGISGAAGSTSAAATSSGSANGCDCSWSRLPRESGSAWLLGLFALLSVRRRSNSPGRRA